MAKQTFYVVIVDEGKPATIHSHSSYTELVNNLAGLVQTVVVGRRQLFVFNGDRWFITKDKYLLPPDNQKIPLVPQTIPTYECDLDGFISNDPKDNPSEPDKDYTVATKINKMLDEEHDDLFVDEKD